MGFLNGQSNSSKTIEKGEKGDRGVGFSLTADEHYHIKNKRLSHLLSITVTQRLQNLSLIY